MRNWPSSPTAMPTITRGEILPGFSDIRPPQVRLRLTRPRWYSISVTNNIIANNVAGWDGGGVSLQDALAVNFINNTVASNDSTASSGVLFNTLGAPDASAPGSNCIQTGSTTASCPQPAGLVTMRNTSLLTSSVAIGHLPHRPWDQWNKCELQELLGSASG